MNRAQRLQVKNNDRRRKVNAKRSLSLPALKSSVSLNNDSLQDKNIATVSVGLEYNAKGKMTNAIELLIRPNDVRCDESGEHPDETGFVLARITREEIEAMLEWLQQDWADHIKYCGGPE